MTDGPRVFEEGTLTVVTSHGGCSVYVGQTKIELYGKVKINFDSESGQPIVELEFQRSHEPQITQKIEEESRAARRIPWLRVKT